MLRVDPQRSVEFTGAVFPRNRRRKLDNLIIGKVVLHLSKGPEVGCITLGGYVARVTR